MGFLLLLLVPQITKIPYITFSSERLNYRILATGSSNEVQTGLTLRLFFSLSAGGRSVSGDYVVLFPGYLLNNQKLSRGYPEDP